MRIIVSLFVIALSLSPTSVFAKYSRAVLGEMPLDQLIENLENLVKAPDNPSYKRYHQESLARVYSMAAIYNLKTVKVRGKSKPIFTKSDDDYVGNGNVLPTDKPSRSSLAEQYFKKSLAIYQEVDLALSPHAQLTYAWTLQQAGQVSKSREIYRRLLKNLLTGRPEKQGSISLVEAEAIEYAVQILDSQEEIEKLKAIKNKYPAKGRRYASPIAVALNPNLPRSEWTTQEKSVHFDLDGFGARAWNWIRPQVAWLVYRPNRAKMNGYFLFGNRTFNTFWSDGYQALSALDDNRNHIIEGRELKRIALWLDKNSNGRIDRGEIESLALHRITGIRCDSEMAANGERWNPSGIVFDNRSTVATYDLILESIE